MIDYFLQQLAKIKKSIIGGYLTSDQDNSKGFIQAQTTRYNMTYTSNIYYPYGYCAKAPKDTQAIIVNLETKPENSFAFPYEPKTQFRDLQNGEVIIGNQEQNIYIKFKKDGSIDIKANSNVNISCSTANITASSEIKLDSPTTQVTGNLNVGGNITATGNINGANITASGSLSDPYGSLQGFRVQYNSHTHTDSQGGQTSTPN